MIPAALILAAALIAFTAAPFVAELKRASVKRRQTAAPGAFADLPQGRTHYQWTGPADGPVAVCIHGLTTPSFVFSGVERSLAALGYRVLTYDLYGRGYSDRPRGAHTPAFFLGQLRGLLADQGITGRLTVMGYSMGGAIAAAFAAKEGKRVQAIILLAPAGIAPIYARAKDRLWTLPVIGDWLMRVLGGWALRRELAGDISQATMVPNLRERLLAETRFRGFLPAVLSSRRHMLSRLFHADHARIRETGTPLLAIWGRDDTVVPISTLGALAHLNPDAHHTEVIGAGHIFLQTHPTQVAEQLKSFLQPA